MPDDEKKGAAVYVGWGTFKNAIDQLAQGLPNRIDRTCFPGLAGGVQSQLLAALKFLDLIDDDGKPTAALRSLAAADEDGRKEHFKKMLQQHYADLFALDLTKTTPGELSETMGKSYNVSGDTKTKAIRFFLAAATWVGIPMSKLLINAAPAASSTSGNGAPRRRRSPARTRAATAPNDDEEEQQYGVTAVDSTAGTARTVNLQSGGTLTISVSLDVLRLSAADRKFVFKLIDELEEYEQGAPSSAAAGK